MGQTFVAFSEKLNFIAKIQQTTMFVVCQRFGDLFLFGLVGQYSSVQKKYNKGRFKVMATYLQQQYVVHLNRSLEGMIHM